MASSNTMKTSKVIDSSSIIDMEEMEVDESDYETNISDTSPSGDRGAGRKRTHGEEPFMEDVQKKVTQNMASYVWQSGSQQAKNAFNTYANIDLLRPYFNVEPHEVRLRLLRSLVPQRPGSQHQKVPRELYGPTMLIFTLIALLLFQMKTGGHSVEEGTLMGTAFGTCFGYWFGVSGFVWFLAYVCNSHITMLQILSLLGYGLFGHCVVLGLTTIFHTAHDHMFFYLMWAIFGGLSTVKMVSVVSTRTPGQTQKLIVCGVMTVLHLCFLLYLHFAYHKMVEDLSDLIDQVAVPLPNRNIPIINQAPKKLMERSVNPNVLSKGLPNVLPPGGAEAIRTPRKISEGARPRVQPVESTRPKEGDKVVADQPRLRAGHPHVAVVTDKVLLHPKGPLIQALVNRTKTI